ncbi:hypothetical protein INT43_007679 [Umbelopsis isabellina]|uniref:Transmembrane protein n=1 Tax=Mortierella isabellina TaxID=91625 RepID=A0A8H7PNJ2_MORIS|nr:hypothetical protein INT43_007679 [Umbelopsis isabellina]
MVFIARGNGVFQLKMPTVLVLIALFKTISAIGTSERPTYASDQPLLQPSASDWMLLWTRILTQYVLWWLTDLLIIVVWKRKSWKIWIHKAMRKILLQWRPGIMFIITCEPKQAVDAYKLLGDDGGPITNTSLAITLLVDLFTIAGGAMSLYKVWNHETIGNGWSIMNLFFAPVPPAIISFFSTLTVIFNTRNRTRIILIILGLVAWPAIMLPLLSTHISLKGMKDDYWVFELVSWMFSMNPFVIIRMEHVIVLFIAFQRLFEILVFVGSDPTTSRFPFPALNTWAFGAPLLIFGLGIVIFAEVALFTVYKNIIFYYTKLKARWSNALFHRKNGTEPPPLALPMHTVPNDILTVREIVPTLPDEPFEKEKARKTAKSQTMATPAATQSQALVLSSRQTQTLRQNQPSPPISRQIEGVGQAPASIATQIRGPDIDPIWNLMFAQRQADGSRPNDTT